MRESRKHGFTLIELLVVIAIIAILAAILFPVFAKAKKQAVLTTCGSNLSQIAKGVTMYASDHSGRLPDIVDSKWYVGNRTVAELAPYMARNREVWRCKGAGMCSTDYDDPDKYGNRQRIDIDYRFNANMLKADGTPKLLDQCTRPKLFYVISDRHSLHHKATTGEPDYMWVMPMVMADGHLSTNVKPYDKSWIRGSYRRYDHWDFPACHAQDTQYGVD